MKYTHTANNLRAAILTLEVKQKEEETILKEQFQIVFESIKPINLIKSTIKEITVSEDLKDNLFNTSVGITTGYISKKLFEGESHNPLRKIFGTALMFGITNTVANNPETIKAVAKVIFKIVTGLKPRHVERAN
ncbi:MAG: hypothetical protein WAT79_02160 [Saprospiraceae bacterium]